MKRKRSGVTRSSLLVLVIVQLSACWTTSTATQYCLTNPTEKLVRHRVNVGDRIDAEYPDGSTSRLKVAEVAGGTLVGREGEVVVIDEVRSLTCSKTEYEPTWLSEGALEGAGAGAAPLIIMVALPTMWGMHLYEKSLGPVRNWTEPQLCMAITESALFEAQAAQASDSFPSIADLRGEIRRRRLNCDPVFQLEKSCAHKFSDGNDFEQCLSSREGRNYWNSTTVKTWSRGVLCHLDATLGMDDGAQITDDSAGERRQLIKDELERRNHVCAAKR